MKYKTTKKAVMNGYSKIICCGYCSLQNLLWHKSPEAYTCGVYGWNADIYEVNGVAICTGYRPFGNIRPDYEMVQKYEKQAEDARHYMSYEEAREKLDLLLVEFVREATGKGATV